MSGTAFVVIISPRQEAVPGVGAERLPDLGFWETPAVHGWLQAFDVEGEAGCGLVRVVPALDEDVIPADAQRLRVPVTHEEAQLIVQAAGTPAAAQVQAELLTFRRVLAERPAMVERARAVGLSPARIDQLAGTPLVAEVEGRQ
ncbi:hypothetical protein K353_03457 [Kitasatospora sp. SolWspMP-SS2h]|uniref:DUF6003 family protein n=1 Tax=Kitasatospora sp. SolWspMP-SS2h TaxID=1305729 RepID=UPI000DB97331|nr:DUF6003 family protein [Kitasatospora sp. SolWspMP-SS2h]RAJ39969.1 hypothetical protein K353_03457 [Kitasatospora sp. SolWspMP-SS2h]